VPAGTQWLNQWQALQALPGRLQALLANGRFNHLSEMLAVVASALLLAVLLLLWPRMARLRRWVLPVALLAILGAGIQGIVMVRSSLAAQAEFAAAQGYPAHYMYNVQDIVDLSESYKERATYHFRRGETVRAGADAVETARIWAWNSWNRIDPIYQGQFPNALGVEAAPGLLLAGYAANAPHGGAMSQAESIWVTLYWQVVEPLPVRMHLYLAAIAPDGQVVAASGYELARGVWPVEQWPAGAVLWEVYELPVAYTLAYPAEYNLVALLYPPESAAGLPAPGTTGQVHGISLSSVELTPQAPQQPAAADFGGTITWLGYDIAKPALAPGEPLDLALYWQARNAQAGQYKTFVHMLNGQGELVAQHDKFPLDSPEPLTGWQPGVQLRDRYRLAVRGTVEPGNYTVYFGWYDPATGARLPVLDAQNNRIGETVTLPVTIEIQSNGRRP
jgi:hypothetical protein